MLIMLKQLMLMQRKPDLQEPAVVQFARVCRVIAVSTDPVSSESAASTQTEPDRCVQLPFITFTNVIIAPAGQGEGELSE